MAEQPVPKSTTSHCTNSTLVHNIRHTKHVICHVAGHMGVLPLVDDVLEREQEQLARDKLGQDD